MKQLILIRHAESEANVNYNVYFEKDKYDHIICLSENGRKQAEECALKLNGMLEGPFMVFMSPYLRTQETYDHIAKGLKNQPTSVIVDGRLREQEFKIFKNKDAESGYDVLNRAGGFYNQLRLDWLLGNREDTVIVVSHEITIRCLLMLALDLPPHEVESKRIRNCEILTLVAGANLKFGLIEG